MSRLFKSLGNRVTANDNLRLGYVFGQAALNISDEPFFSRLSSSGEIGAGESGLLPPTNYDRVLGHLNALRGEEGFIFREYSPGGSSQSDHERQYFSDENARKIDGIRREIQRWKHANLLDEAELCLLLVDLMRAVNRVANIAGTYGFFMKQWDPRAQRQLRLERSPIHRSPFRHHVFCKDANEIVREIEFDAIYLDPTLYMAPLWCLLSHLRDDCVGR